MVLVIGGKDYHLTNEEWMLPAAKNSLSQLGANAKNHKKIGVLGPQLMAQTGSDIDLVQSQESEKALT